MNIAHVRLAFNSLAEDWIKVVTGSAAAVVILGISYLPLGTKHPWIPWSVFVFMWSLTWAWAFVRSWNREHDEVERLKQLLLDEYVAHVVARHKDNIIWNLAHERDLAASISGDQILIQRAIESVKTESLGRGTQKLPTRLGG